MDIQYYGGDCVVFTAKDVRVVVDDNLSELGLKSITKATDIVLFTGPHNGLSTTPRLLIDQPGEYEVSNLSIIGIAARGHMDEPGTRSATIYKILTDDASYLVTGHVYPDLSDDQLEAIGMVDVMCVPVGGNGYTLDATGALQLIKKIEPKLVIPTHYAEEGVHYSVDQQSLEQALKNLAMEPKDTTSKLRIKSVELVSGGATQLAILTRS